jgi:hypothetical protein
MQTKRSLILTTAFDLLAVLLLQTAPAQTINPGVIDPTNTYAGKTYSEWSAVWWQHFVSLPSTNNPSWFDSLHPVIPLSLSQSGPVWFIGGNYPSGGTHLYTNTIPGGIGLFLLVAAHEGDNATCPITNSYTEAQLRAAQKSVVDGVTSMTCTIDSVAVSGLTSVLTSPYRVQSTVFDYTCPAVHNYLYDHRSLTCYQNSSGTPYTITGAVEDGVFLMVAPLSVGSHVIHVTCAFPAFGLTSDFTHYLTVKPVALAVDASAQPGNLVLSWPQTPDNYTVRSSPGLSPPDWQPADLIVTTNNGILQATAPVGTTNQFFRLRLN